MAFDYFYVELRNAKGKRPYFWGQDKATTASVGDSIRVKTKKKDIEQLLQIPGPTYIMSWAFMNPRTSIRSIRTYGSAIEGDHEDTNSP